MADLSTYDPIFKAAGDEWGVDPRLLKAIAIQESGGNPRAVSRAGAQGLMQIMPETQKTLGVTDPNDPVQSIYGAAKYMDRALRVEGSPEAALLNYHGGDGWRQAYGPESQAYVPAVTSHYVKLAPPPGAEAQPTAPTGPLIIGDSLASKQGLGGTGVVGAQPKAVLDSITGLPDDQVKGRDVVLSSGASNNPAQAALVEQQIKTLKDRGANTVTVVGVGDHPKLAGVNDTLAASTTRAGGQFVPVPADQLSPDRIHPTPQGYRTLLADATPRTATDATPVSAPAPTAPTGAGNAMPKDDPLSLLPPAPKATGTSAPSSDDPLSLLPPAPKAATTAAATKPATSGQPEVDEFGNVIATSPAYAAPQPGQAVPTTIAGWRQAMEPEPGWVPSGVLPMATKEVSPGQGDPSAGVKWDWGPVRSVVNPLLDLMEGTGLSNAGDQSPLAGKVSPEATLLLLGAKAGNPNPLQSRNALMAPAGRDIKFGAPEPVPPGLAAREAPLSPEFKANALTPGAATKAQEIASPTAPSGAQPPGAGPTFLDRSWLLKAGDNGDGTFNMGKGGTAISDAAQQALDSGAIVQLVTDGGAKVVDITQVKNGMLVDAKGQPWGGATVAFDGTGREGLRITGGSGVPAPSSPTGIPVTSPPKPAAVAPEAPVTEHTPWVSSTTSDIQQVLQENVEAGGPTSLGAMATPEQLATMTPAQMKANRRVAELNQIVTPIEGEDTTQWVQGSTPTEAERMGTPTTSQKEVMTRQRNPDAFEGPNGQLTINDKARVNAFDETLLSDTRAADLKERQQVAASQAQTRILSTAKPVDLKPAADWIEAKLADPLIQEDRHVFNSLKQLRDQLYDADGNLKTDPRAAWGMHNNLRNKLLDAKDPFSANPSEKYAVTQVNEFKGLVDGALDKASDGQFRVHLDTQAEFLKSLNAWRLLNDFRYGPNKMINAKSGMINANAFHRFVTDLGIRRGRPGIDAAMDIPDDVMQRLINIDQDLKRAGRIDLGKPRGSPTNLFFELAGALGISGAHALTAAMTAGTSFGGIANIGVQTGIGAVQRRLGQRRINRLTEQALQPPPGGLTPPPGNPLQQGPP